MQYYCIIIILFPKYNLLHTKKATAEYPNKSDN